SGNLYPEKGIDLILRLAKIITDIDFWLVGGKPSDIKFWQKHQIKNGIKNLYFTGFVQHGNLPDVLQNFNGFLLTQSSLSAEINSNAPLKLQEYACFKKPVFASPITAFYNAAETNK